MHVSIPQKLNGVEIVPWSELADIEMVSFDVFDTLLFRRSGTPHDFFVQLAQSAINNGLWTDGELSAFTELRILAESQARSAKFALYGHREVTLEEIYQAWPQVDTEKMCQLEASLELADWHINSGIISWINELHKNGKRLAIVSDMYLEKKVILAFLERYLSVACFELVLISGTIGCSKHDGGLFLHLIQESGLLPEQILHLGDNPITDGQMAKACGIKSNTQDLERINTVTGFERRLTASAPSHIDALRKQWIWEHSHPSDAASTGALIYGPYLWGFACWLLQRCNALGVKQLFFLLREGDLLSSVLNTINDGSVIVSTLAISRRASLLPSLMPVNIDVLHQLSQRRAYTLAECLEDLNLPTPKSWQPKLSKELKTIVSTPLWTELQQLFIEHLDDIKAYLSQQRNLLEQYLTQQGVTNSWDVALVDWGCGASLFGNICRILPLYNARFFMAYASKKSQSFALEYALESFMPIGSERAQTIAESPEVSEILLNGTLASTKSYSLNGNKVIAIAVPTRSDDEEQLKRLTDFREGVLSFCILAQPLADKSLTEMSIVQREALSAILYRFIQYPMTEEAKALADMPVPLFKHSNRALVPQVSVNEFAKRFGRVGSGYEGITLGNYQTSTITAWLPAALALAFPSSTGLYGELAVTTGNEVVAPMLLQQLKLNGIKYTAIYGAGELGIQVLEVLSSNCIEISCFIDRRADAGSFTIEGLNVMTLEEAIIKGESVFSVASKAFAHEIVEYIESIAKITNKTLTVCTIAGIINYE